MSNEDRRRILQLVADGKITAEEATELLDALQSESARGGTENPSESAFPVPPVAPRAPIPPRAPVASRSLIILVTEGPNTKVNLRIPFGLARAAGKFVPRRAQQQLKEVGIDLEEMLTDLTGSENGTILQVEDEDNRVLIAVE